MAPEVRDHRTFLKLPASSEIQIQPLILGIVSDMRADIGGKSYFDYAGFPADSKMEPAIIALNLPLAMCARYYPLSDQKFSCAGGCPDYRNRKKAEPGIRVGWITLITQLYGV